MPRMPCPHRPAARAVPPRAGHDELEQCDGLMVLVLDPVTGAADTYGPYPAGRAHQSGAAPHSPNFGLMGVAEEGRIY